MIFLDVNIVLYAQGKPHLYKERCSRWMKRMVEGEVEVAINSEILQELIYFYHRQKKLGIGVQTYRVLTHLVRAIHPIHRTTTDLALEVLIRHPSLSYRDAIHVATMRETGITEIASFDHHFDRVDGITRLEP